MMVRLVVPFKGMAVEPNALAMVGGATTARDAALLVVPVPPSVELTGPLVLLFAPAVVPVTLTATVQFVLAAIDPPDKLIVLVPAVAVTEPPHTPLDPFGVATTNPEGSVLLNATPEREDALPFVIVKVRLVEPFRGTEDAPKALLMVGGATTVRVAVLLVAPAPPWVELMVPVVLFLVPAVVPVTLTATVQFALAASEPADRLMVPDPDVAVTVPPHTPLDPFGVDTTKPEGNVSLKAIPDNAEALGFVIVKVRLVEPFKAIEAAPNALLIVGGATTVTLAVLLVVPVPPWVELIAPVVLL